MEIVINLPDPIEGEYDIDAKKGVIRIRPKFFKGAAQQAVLYLLVTNPLGREHKAILAVKAKDGQFAVNNQSPPVYVEPGFDSQPPDDPQAHEEPPVPTADRAGASRGPVGAGAEKPRPG